MATIDKVAGYVDNFVTGTLFDGTNAPIENGIAQIQAYKITVTDDSGTAIDLQDKDGDALGEENQLVELLIQEMQPLMYFAPSDASGEIHVVMDGHGNTPSALENRLRPIVVGAGYGTDVDNNQTSVQQATSMTFGTT